MTRRKYPQFFDQEPSLAMLEYEAKRDESKTTVMGKLAMKQTNHKKKEVVTCQDCELYNPGPNGEFGCNRPGRCIHI